jgi:Lon protease-like protein
LAGAQSIPSRFPIFPLRGCLVLPGGNLPFNIFEPRYLAMVEDALRGDSVIGMIQPVATASRAKRPQVFKTGCACRITDCSPTDDGRLEITLTGVCRFDVAEELKVATPYRQVIADFSRWKGDLASREPDEGLRPRLLGATRRYFEGQGITTDWETLERMPLLAAITTLSMLCPFGAVEKQALLEAADSGMQGELLVTIMQMELPGSGGEEPVVRH